MGSLIMLLISLSEHFSEDHLYILYNKYYSQPSNEYFSLMLTFGYCDLISQAITDPIKCHLLLSLMFVKSSLITLYFVRIPILV
jgi:hypothetical protein